MFRALLFLLMGCVLLAPLGVLAQNFSSSNYNEVSPTIVPGGYGTSSTYNLYGTFGEVAHGSTSSASYGLNLGFFSFPIASAPVVTPVVGNGSGRVDLSWTASIPFLGYQVSGYQIGRSLTSGGPYSYTAVGNTLTPPPVTGLVDGTTYYFVVRATDPASIPIATSTEVSAVPISPSLTFIIDSGSQSLPSLTPGVLAATSSILQVKTNNTNGFVVTLSRTNATATLMLSGDSVVGIADKTEWLAPTGLNATTTPGPATASTTQPQTLQFRLWKAQTDLQNYATAWWGTDDTSANALFAGIPTTTETIVNSSVPALATSTARILYDVNVPPTQKTGTYSGDVVYSAMTNP